MLRYYIYYSVGGYKEMYLGSSNDHYDACYYLPLLPIYEERLTAQFDDSLHTRVAYMRSLQQVGELHDSKRYGLPQSALSWISHGGYKLIYGHLEDNVYAFAMRDIACNMRDETDRTAPFLFLVTCDDVAELPMLERFTAYCANCLREASEAIASFIEYDMTANGLKINFALMKQWIERVAAQQTKAQVHSITVLSRCDTIGLLVLSSDESTVCNELGLQHKRIRSISISSLLNEKQTGLVVQDRTSDWLNTLQDAIGLHGWQFYVAALLTLMAVIKLLDWLF